MVLCVVKVAEPNLQHEAVPISLDSVSSPIFLEAYSVVRDEFLATDPEVRV
jgi:hypothetical protein